MNAIFAYAKLNARILPLDRVDRYEEPLKEALNGKNLAKITGGGTQQLSRGEIEYCGIDLDLYDIERSVPFICEVLESCGAPKGCALTYEINGVKHDIPFGQLEGLGIYFNGTDLPSEVYKNSDINHVFSELNRLLGERGTIQGHWQGPTETALYLYGLSVNEMKLAIADFMADYPLCQRARFEVVA